MKIHKEGYKIILYTALALLLVNVFLGVFLPGLIILPFIHTGSLIFFLLVVFFFRVPKRDMISDENAVIAAADGKIVAIEEVEETEYFNERRLQVSIFMSPLNVHVNRFPVSGIIKYFMYHPGSYLVAWHPKSSTKNERTSIVIENKGKGAIMLRQIAGAMARRIVWYPKEGDDVAQNAQLGFIKFGSRVDIFLPLNAIINVELNQKVKGGQTIIAHFSG